MAYQRRVDTLHPGCVIVLVDQSDSMSEPSGKGAFTKGSAVAACLNGLLYELVLRCVKNPGEGARPYFFVAVLGYGTLPDGSPAVGSVLRGALRTAHFVSTAELAANPLRIDRTLDEDGHAVSRPVWVEADAHGGTPMCAAFEYAGRLVHHWIGQHRDSFPPIVLNLTDGEPTDGDPSLWVERIRQLSSADGQPLLFNLEVATEGHPVLFPNSVEGLESEYARMLFQISSVLPDDMVQSALAQGIPLRPGARGFGFNADVRSIATFLNVGTAAGRMLR